MSEAGRSVSKDVKRLEGPPSAGANQQATPASASGPGQINVTPLENPTSAGSSNGGNPPVATIVSINNNGGSNTEVTRANTDANSTGGGGGANAT